MCAIQENAEAALPHDQLLILIGKESAADYLRHRGIHAAPRLFLTLSRGAGAFGNLFSLVGCPSPSVRRLESVSVVASVTGTVEELWLSQTT